MPDFSPFVELESSMSRFLSGLFKSSSNQVNGGLFGGAWLAVIVGLLNSEELRQLLGDNVELMAILGGIQALAAIFMRSRKGHKKISDRADGPLIGDDDA